MTLRLGVFFLPALLAGLTAACTVLKDDAPLDDRTRADAGVVGGQGVSCTALPDNAVDFYVDAASTSNGPLGSAQCPFRTITAALDAARASSPALKTVHVAAGTYSSYNGEKFPLDLRAGVSLRGAGSDATILDGAGFVTSARNFAMYWRSFLATVTTGDSALVTVLSGVSLRASNVGSFTNLHGQSYGDPDEINAVFVDQGNTPLLRSGAPFPAPTTVLWDVNVASGYDVGVRIVAKDQGANVSVTKSTFHGGPSAGGQWSAAIYMAGLGCGSPLGPPPAHAIPIALTVGDGTPDGANTFLDTTAPGEADAISVEGCVDRVTVRRNLMKQSSSVARGGAALVVRSDRDDKSAPPVITFDDNTVDGLIGGVLIDAGRATVGVNENTFVNVRAAPGARVAAAALDLSAARTHEYPGLVTAHGNTFVGNDVGVRIGPVAVGAGSTFDFGTSAASGENEFRCNSTPSGVAFPGADVWLADATGSPSITLSGNRWDHAAPTSATGASPTNGLDVFSGGAALPPSVVLAPSTQSSLVCPASSTP